MIRHTIVRQVAQSALAAAMAVSMAAAATAPKAVVQTHTVLAADTVEKSGRTVATLTATVFDDDGTPASGAVSILDRGRSVGSAALDVDGKAEIHLDGLTAGDHSLHAVYMGDDAHAASQSESVVLHPQANATTPDFSLALSATTLTILAPGDSGSLKATINPIAGFTGFISLSCSGPANATTLPVGVTCSFAPANLQVTTTGAATSDLTIVTSAGQSENRQPNGIHGNGSPLILAFLLPGAVGLGFVASKRKIFGKAALLLTLGVISLLGTTGCSARYYYLHHGPTFGGTAAGAYTINIIAQTSNGVTASSHTQSIVMTVK